MSAIEILDLSGEPTDVSSRRRRRAAAGKYYAADGTYAPESKSTINRDN